MTDLLVLRRMADYFDATPTREQIERLEQVLLSVPDAHVDFAVEHVFAPGIYCRKLVIEAGTVLTGKVHLSEHLSVSCGDITVWTEDGMRRLTGTHTLVAQPGAKRVGYAHERTTWINVHPNPDNCRDLAVLESRFVLPGRPLLANQ